MSKLLHEPGDLQEEIKLLWEVLFAASPEIHREYEKIIMVRKLLEEESKEVVPTDASHILRLIRARRLGNK